MDVDQAIEIVTKLADGVDPTTGERLPPSSVYQQADTARALHLALEGLDRLGAAGLPLSIGVSE
ncbi:MAG: hypothetical protein QME60_04740 [Verrucomicrobiota bacterium]|nr:hypothetical protein [Verrucomicrobiota bacterium]